MMGRQDQNDDPTHHRALQRLGNVLVCSYPCELDDPEIDRLLPAIFAHLATTRARALLVDLAAVRSVDSRGIGKLRDLTRAVGLAGKWRVMVVGIAPSIAVVVAEMGLSLAGVACANNLAAGLRQLDDLATELG